MRSFSPIFFFGVRLEYAKFVFDGMADFFTCEPLSMQMSLDFDLTHQYLTIGFFCSKPDSTLPSDYLTLAASSLILRRDVKAASSGFANLRLAKAAQVHTIPITITRFLRGRVGLHFPIQRVQAPVLEGPAVPLDFRTPPSLPTDARQLRMNERLLETGSDADSLPIYCRTAPLHSHESLSPALRKTLFFFHEWQRRFSTIRSVGSRSMK